MADREPTPQIERLTWSTPFGGRTKYDMKFLQDVEPDNPTKLTILRDKQYSWGEIAAMARNPKELQDLTGITEIEARKMSSWAKDQLLETRFGQITISENAHVEYGGDMFGGNMTVLSAENRRSWVKRGQVRKNSVTIGAGATVSQVIAGDGNTQINNSSEFPGVSIVVGNNNSQNGEKFSDDNIPEGSYVFSEPIKPEGGIFDAGGKTVVITDIFDGSIVNARSVIVGDNGVVLGSISSEDGAKVFGNGFVPKDRKNDDKSPKTEPIHYL